MVSKPHIFLRAIRTVAHQALVSGVALFVLTQATLAQEPAQPAVAAQPAQSGMVKITFPPETELRLLIEFVSERLKTKILFDEQVANKKISIKAPEEIPADTLLDILRSALKMKGLALIESETKGWLKIVVADDLTRIAEPQQDQKIEDFPGTTAVTQAFPLAHMGPDRVKTIIEPFLTKQGANSITFPDKNLLIVTDYAHNLRRIAQLITAIDQAGPERILKLYTAQHIDAGELAQKVSQALTSRAPAQAPGITPATLNADKRTNQMLVVGTKVQIEEVLELAKAFDVALEQRTQIYSFKFVAAERIDKLVRDIVDPLTIDRLYRSAIDRDDNLLVATGTEPIHQRIEWLRKELDIETKRPGSGVKFYRLKYADAEEVLNTLRAIEQQNERPSGSYRRGVSSIGRGGVGGSRSVGPRESPIDFVPGANNPNVPGRPALEPPALRKEISPQGAQPAVGPAPGSMLDPGAALDPRIASEVAVPGMGTIVPGAARVSVDPNTNSIIVIADRGVQQVYEELIKALDKRRPQVMIEAKVVILDTSDDFSLGVEMSFGDRSGVNRLLQFTSYGLSTVDPVSGALALVPGRGFNWTLVDPDSADAVIRALSTHRRAKVTSAPRILVNDNATGTLASVTEVPFTSVNASNTVATTSFAGFAEAGTTIEATPRITDDDHLQLEFSVALNSFTGDGGEGIPPPRQTDQVESSVTVPDGYTVIVGGLTRKNMSSTYDGVPGLEKIPLIRYLSSAETIRGSQTTLFVFLRPVILRDDKFRDLKYLSDRDLPRAREGGNFPSSSGPLLIR